MYSWGIDATLRPDFWLIEPASFAGLSNKQTKKTSKKSWNQKEQQ